MALHLTPIDRSRTDGQRLPSRVSNARRAKFISYLTQALEVDTATAVRVRDVALERYREARGDDSAAVSAFGVINTVRQEMGLEPYDPADVRRLWDGFDDVLARQREIGEMLFYRAIERHNDRADRTSTNPSERPILMSAAIRAHDEWLEAYRTGDAIQPLSAMREILGDHFGINAPTLAQARSIANEYDQITAPDGNGNLTGLYPVSPYDARFRDLSSASERGSRLGVIDLLALDGIDHDVTVEDLVSGAVPVDIFYDRRQRFADSLMSSLAESGSDAIEQNRVDVALTDATDISGFGRLRPYMTDAEWQASSSVVRDAWAEVLDPDFDWSRVERVTGVVSVEGLDGILLPGNGDVEAQREAFIQNSRRAVGRAVAICQALIDRGYDYKVKPARNLGQIELEVEDLGVTVRLMDTPEEIYYVGRVNSTQDMTQSYVSVNVDADARGFAPNGNSLRQVVRASLGSGYGRNERSQEVNSRLRQVARSLSFAANFEVPDEVFVDNVLYFLGDDVSYEGHRIGEGDAFSMGASVGRTKNDNASREFMAVGGIDVSIPSGQVVHGDIQLRTETTSRWRSRTPLSFANDASVVGAKFEIGRMITNARDNFAAQVNLPEIARIARRTAQDALASGEEFDPETTPVPNEIVYGERAVTDPVIGRLREAYWRALATQDYDISVARLNGEPPRRPRFALANMAFDEDRIYETLGGVLVETDDLKADADVIRFDDTLAQVERSSDEDIAALAGDITHAYGYSAVSEHLAYLMDDYFGYIDATADENSADRAFYYGADSVFGDVASYVRTSGDIVAIGRDSEVRTNDKGGTYLKRGVSADLGSLSNEAVGTVYEGSQQLSSDTIVNSDKISIDLAHVLAYQSEGTYGANKGRLRSAYLRVFDDAVARGLGDGTLQEVPSLVEGAPSLSVSLQHVDTRGSQRFFDDCLRSEFELSSGAAQSVEDLGIVTLAGLRERVGRGEELGLSDAFRLRMLETVESALVSTRCKVSDADIHMDVNGVVTYEARRLRKGKTAKGITDDQIVRGVIGQVFVPEDEHGLFDVRFSASDGYYLAGGNKIHFIDQMSHEGDYLDRMRVTQFADVVEHEIFREVRSQVIGARKKYNAMIIGSPTCINGVWRDDAVTTRFARDLFEDTPEHLQDDDTRDRCIEGAKGKCRFVGFDAEEETSILATERVANTNVHDWVDDREHSGQGLTGHAETSHITEKESAYFDFRRLPTDKKVASTRYMVSGAEVAEDGSINPGKPMDRSPLTEHPAMQYSDCDPHNRQQMGQGNLNHCTSVDLKPVAFAQAPLGGWTQDDGMVVSKAYAESHPLVGKDGVRPLMAGDKIGETHGNKGVISLVVDPDMDIDAEIEKIRTKHAEAIAEAKKGIEETELAIAAIEQRRDRSPKTAHPDDFDDIAVLRGQIRAYQKDMSREERMASREIRDVEALREVVKFFKNNTGREGVPDLSIVMSPFSVGSRMNMGQPREALANESYDLIMNDGSVVEGGIGMVRSVVHDKAVDLKTNTVNGRTSGYQFMHVMLSCGCDNTVADIGRSNAEAMRAFTEALRTGYGFDVSDGGDLSSSISYPDPDSAAYGEIYRFDEHIERNNTSSEDSLGEISETSSEQAMSWLASRGGFMELPFELSWPDIVVSGESAEEVANTLGLDVSEDGSCLMHGQTTPQMPNGRYLMPVMDARERVGITTGGEGYQSHEYTGMYVSIYRSAIKYERARERADRLASDIETLQQRIDAAQERIDSTQGSEQTDAKSDLEKLTRSLQTAESGLRSARSEMTKAESAAQGVFTSLATTVRERGFDSKENIAKKEMMGAELPGRYATTPWSGDPRLDLDEVAIGPKLAEDLKLRDGDQCIIWRAPCLTESTARAVKVRIDERLYGAAVNPEIAKPIGGDFDGDTIGIGRPYDRKAAAELFDKLSLSRELVERRRGSHGLSMGKNTDLTFAGYYHPEVTEQIADVEVRAKEVYERHDKAGTLDEPTKWTGGRDGEPERIGYGAEMQPFVDELSGLVREGFSHEIGTKALSFASAAKYLQSVFDVCIDTGTKGKPAVMEKLARNLGVTDLEVTEDASGKHVINQERLVDTGHTLQTYADYESVEDAGALKTFATGEVGTFQQKFYAAFPGHFEMCHALSEPIYQMALDWKHDGPIAREQHGMIQAFNDLFSGKAYEFDDKGQFVPVWEKDGTKAIETDPKRWVKNVMYVFHAVDKDTFDPKYVDEMASLLYDKESRHVMSFAERSHKVSSVLVRAAFTEKSAAIVSGCVTGANLFMSNTGDEGIDRRMSVAFAPGPVRTEVERKLDERFVSDEDGLPEHPAPKSAEMTAEEEKLAIVSGMSAGTALTEADKAAISDIAAAMSAMAESDGKGSDENRGPISDSVGHTMDGSEGLDDKSGDKDKGDE